MHCGCSVWEVSKWCDVWVYSTFGNVGGVKSLQKAIGLSPFTADHHVVTRLIPEVVAKGRGPTGHLPVSLHVEGCTINQNKPSCRGVEGEGR